MDRRTFLATSFAVGLSGPAVASPPKAPVSKASVSGFVTSEIGKLQRVVVHPPGAETLKTFPMFLGNHSMLTWELLRPEAARQHRAFVEQLSRGGAEVLFLEELLDESIRQAREQGTFVEWLREAAPRLVEHENKMTAASLLGRNDEFVYSRDESHAMQPLIRPTTSLFFTRDLAVMTPRGVVICNFNTDVRSFEATLTRFVFENSPTLAKYPIVFDAGKEGVYVQGGDIMVADENELIVGVGNATQEKTAILLAQELELDVVAVQMPSADWQPGEWEGLQAIFYHLDCLLNFVDRRQVLAVPYLLEKEYVDRNPLLDVLYGIARLCGLGRAQRIAMLDEVRNVGWVRRYKAGSGDRDTTLEAVKLLDYLKAAGHRVVYAGGQLPAGDDDLKHVVERVIRECRFMSVNVVGVEPAHVISYAGNDRTRLALQEAGVQVTTFPSHELVRANGGPHCLTMPLERHPAPRDTRS